MSDLADVFTTLNRLRDEAAVVDYAIGGATAVLFYAEHLVALALHAGGGRRRECAWQLLQTASIDRGLLTALLERHGISAELPDDV